MKKNKKKKNKKLKKNLNPPFQFNLHDVPTPKGFEFPKETEEEIELRRQKFEEEVKKAQEEGINMLLFD